MFRLFEMDIIERESKNHRRGMDLTDHIFPLAFYSLWWISEMGGRKNYQMLIHLLPKEVFYVDDNQFHLSQQLKNDI